ncbi:MAG: hypothetical protein LLG01_05910 [Planctomycetaceae bacterium]|nr:hypothetical protein [Planctomycetaceae bacterium]
MAQSNRVVLIERLRAIHRLAVWYHLRRGHEVRIFDFTQDLKRRPWLAMLVNAGRVQRIYIDPLARAHGESIDLTDMLYPALACPATRLLRGLLAGDQAHLVAKKSLLPSVFACLFVDDYLSDLARQAGAGAPPPIFYADQYPALRNLIDRTEIRPMAPKGAMRIPRWASMLQPLLKWWSAAKFALPRHGALWGQLALLSLARLLRLPRPPQRRVRYAMLIEQPFQLRLKGKRYFDFLLDGSGLSADNTIFCFRTAIDGNAALHCRQRGYHVLDLRDLARPTGLLHTAVPWAIIGRAIGALLRLTLPAAAQIEIMDAAVRGLQVYVEQAVLAQRLHADHYVYTNQEHPKQLAANILLRQGGTRTWNYTLAIGGTFIYATDRDKSLFARRHHLWAYLNSDHYIAATADAVRYNRLHAQDVGAYHDVGCIYSQMVREYLQDPGKAALQEEVFGRPLPDGAPLAAFFDTTFVYDDASVTTFQDALAFFADILRLLDDMPLLHVLVKPSKDPSYFTDPLFQWSRPELGRRVVELCRRLQNHPRVRWAGIEGRVPAIISASDVTVTHCLSSPTFEALGAGRKAFWYDPRNTCRGVLYDQAPGLIAHGYEQLLARTRELLEMDEAIYSDYLRREIAGKVETYVDGRGLDRFRQLLTS